MEKESKAGEEKDWEGEGASSILCMLRHRWGSRGKHRNPTDEVEQDMGFHAVPRMP